VQQTSGGNIKPESIETYAVYNGSTGEVYHIHQVVNFKGAMSVNRHDVEAHALSLAREQIAFDGNLKVLHVPNDILRLGIIHAVDLNTLSLVARPEEKLRQRGVIARRLPQFLLNLLAGLLGGILIMAIYFLLR
jgi:hypothetical protein